MTKHKTVLPNVAIEYLNVQPGKLYVDVTFGGGGHSEKILQQDDSCELIGLDWDKDSLEKNSQGLIEKYPDRFKAIWGNFAHLERVLKKEGIAEVDGILADFGTSQMQLLDGTGFSFFKDTFLDMRMSPAHQKITACDIINNYPEKELANLFFDLGEERASKRIAREIVAIRKSGPIKTTGKLVEIIEGIVPFKGKSHPATRVFQALRMKVNSELENIHSFLCSALKLLKKNGRLVCISFHSLEDREVKHFFRLKKQEEELKILTPKVVIASDEELSQNPSARSAKLRAAERL